MVEGEGGCQARDWVLLQTCWHAKGWHVLACGHRWKMGMWTHCVHVCMGMQMHCMCMRTWMSIKTRQKMKSKKYLPAMHVDVLTCRYIAQACMYCVQTHGGVGGDGRG